MSVTERAPYCSRFPKRDETAYCTVDQEFGRSVLGHGFKPCREEPQICPALAAERGPEQ